MMLMVLIALFPAASVAVMVIRFVPDVRAIGADQEVVPTVVPTAPVAAFVQVTDARPMVSDAVPETVTLGDAVLNVGWLVGPTVEIVGGVVSRVADRTAVEIFPAVSVAVTVIVLRPETNGMPALQEPVPVAVPLAGTAGLDQLTLATATLSLAVPAINRGLTFVNVVPDAVGTVIATEGATES